MDIVPPTPPHSEKVDAVLPVQNDENKNGYPHLIPPTNYKKPESHLNDDYSNMYYSDSDEEEDLCDFEEDDDDRLEMHFGRKKAANWGVQIQEVGCFSENIYIFIHGAIGIIIAFMYM